VGQKIRFKSCIANTQPDKEYYDFNKTDNVSFNDTTKFFTYTQPGTYVVTQLINTGQVIQKERTFVVLATPPPVFTVVACALNQVRVNITDTNYDKFLVDFGDGAQQNLNRGASVTHPYAQAGPFKITVTGSYTGATCSQQAEVTVPALPAANAPVIENIRLTTPGATGNIPLSLKNLQSAYYYILERIEGTSATPLDTLKNPANATLTYTLPNANNATPACFRVRVTDRCGSNLNTNSNIICNQPLNASSGNNQIELAWPAYPAANTLLNYELYRNGTLYQTLPANNTTYTDVAVTCGQSYCYQLKAILKNNYSSISNEACVTAITTNTPAAGYLSSSFTPGNQVVLTFQVPGTSPAKSITYQKSLANASFTDLKVTDQTSFTDISAGINTLACYQAIYEDACGKTSAATNKTCPVLLRAVLNPDGTVNLSWSEYIGFTAGTPQYTVERLNAGTVISSTPVSGTTFSEKNNSSEQQLVYRIKSTSGNGAEISYSNTEMLRRESIFAIPNAFSPNGDNLNDRFEIKGNIYGSFRLLIYDRWGQVIFSSSSPRNNWDGKINGREAPVGVYAYSLTATDQSGVQIVKTGTVTLVR